MNILFLYATQSVDRKGVYVEACRELRRAYGHQVVFCYNGPRLTGIEDLHVEHFDSWVEKNRDKIDKENLTTLERRFPESNLWRCAVVERNLTDYSFIGASFPASRYQLTDIEWYLKALVLFYDMVLDQYHVDIAFNQVSDNIHAHVIYELARSKDIVPLSLGRGIYWFDDLVYAQTDTNYGSEVLRDRYLSLRHGSNASAGNLDRDFEAQIARVIGSEARQERPHLVYSKSVLTLTRNALLSLAEVFARLRFFRPAVQDSNLYLTLWSAARSYLVRLRNLVNMRLFVRETDVPEEPFVFFPLPLQPEATLLGASPGWLDQLSVARLLSASLPAGYRLVVKDHPMTGGTHDPRFYRSVRALNNVVLLDERVSGRAVAKLPNCALVVTIGGGTVGLEAMLSGKPVLMVGRTYYDCMSTLLRPPKDLNDLPHFMKRTLVFGEHPTPDQIAADATMLLAAWMSIMKPVGSATYSAQGDEGTAGRDWARLVHELSLQVGTRALAGSPSASLGARG